MLKSSWASASTRMISRYFLCLTEMRLRFAKMYSYVPLRGSNKYKKKEEAATYKILSCLPNHKSPLKAKNRWHKVGVINILHCEEFKTRRKQTTIKCYGTDTNTPTSLKLNIEWSWWSCSPNYNHQHQVYVSSFQREVSLRDRDGSGEGARRRGRR